MLQSTKKYIKLYLSVIYIKEYLSNISLILYAFVFARHIFDTFFYYTLICACLNCCKSVLQIKEWNISNDYDARYL